ncbi:MAG: chorismate mutase [Acidobacteria bacterium]|jgi:chorismate mutase|nr:MAG: chorismate mutase [Acidobacteriota bacterium]
MNIADWRKKIDELDQRLVELLSERAKAAHEIGRLKRAAGLPIYEPDRERTVLDHVAQVNPGPLPESDLRRIYKSIMDIMRKIQREEIAPESVNAQAAAASPADSEVDPDSNH